MKSKFALLAGFMALATPLINPIAHAASLKENITVYSNVVVAGDLFDGLDEYLSLIHI